jgi:large subunit ribosomal protein L25
MSTIVLEAKARLDTGKGASRRLRRLENKVPGVIYGGDKKPHSIYVLHNKLVKALENEAIYSSILNIDVDGEIEQVILKDLQRHPYKPVILHIDLQRVSSKDILVKHVPIHFINEQTAKGVKAGGIVNHLMTQIEIRCQANCLPEFIEIDLANLVLNQTYHLSDLILPTGTELTVDINDSQANTPVVSIHQPKDESNFDEDADAITSDATV